ncbi:chromate efflux transporter [Acinetobacter defluvii]|uniref:Chromate efflux transporter n=1 Tax=Acinetobacter defluvii TaxID=1871111 RepID=A0A2S2FCB8_9GAMM|nr:chromate efflux transporter [Acinetobacter defluvii]AWL28621.1 chromate efflux transporter [Acinetobacter defluvii]
MSNITQNKFSNFYIFMTFLRLGCIAFGGPAAHIVLFHNYLIKKLSWLDEQEYFKVLALAQIIPGPTSSQVGITLGYLKNGYSGAFCAWLGFTLPSAILMAGAAWLGQYFFENLNLYFFHIIQLIVLAVVFWAFWQMLRSLCHHVWQYIVMLFSAVFIYAVPLSANQIIVILLAALLGLLLAQEKPKQNEVKNTQFQLKSSKAYLWLILFALPFLLFPILNHVHPSLFIQAFAGFYRSASLVFGGGHIVLPLLHQDFVATGLISNEKFDLGYAIAQLMPGPLFSFASYLGALLPFTSSILINASLATIMIYLPSFVLVFGTLPYWSWLMQQQKIYKAIQGINAAVVGLLLCLIIQMTEKYIVQWLDVVFVMMVILLLKTKLPVWLTLIASFMSYYFYLNNFVMP